LRIGIYGNYKRALEAELRLMKFTAVNPRKGLLKLEKKVSLRSL